MDNMTGTLIFLVEALFTIYLVAFIIRLLSVRLQGEYHNSIMQFILRVTHPLILPLRYVVRRHRPVDFAAIIAMCVVALVYVYVDVFLQTQYWMDLPSALLMALGTLLHLWVSTFFWAILVESVLSWIVSSARHIHEPRVVAEVVARPVMRPLRQIIKPMAGFDLSPLVALILLKLIDVFFVSQILQLSLERVFGG